MAMEKENATATNLTEAASPPDRWPSWLPRWIAMSADPAAPLDSAGRGAAAEVARTDVSDFALALARRIRGFGEERSVALALACLSIGSLFLVWYVGTRYRIDLYIRFKNIPTPYAVFQQLGEVIHSAKYATNILVSLERIASGFTLAILMGVPLGLVVGRYRRIGELVMPAIEVLRPIPAIAWVPISIMLWPNNEASIVFITFIGAFFPILLNTVQGVRSMDGVLLRAGSCLGAGEPQMLWHVVLPAALPNIFTGLAVGMGVAWVSLIAAEMISGQFGIGYYTWEAYSLVNYPAIVLGMITIGVLGLACSGAIRAVGTLCMPWLAFSAGARR